MSTQTTEKQAELKVAHVNPFKGLPRKVKPYARLAKMYKGHYSYGHIHKIVKYGKYLDKNGEHEVLKNARRLANVIQEDIKKREEAALAPLEINQ